MMLNIFSRINVDEMNFVLKTGTTYYLFLNVQQLAGDARGTIPYQV